jgi:hypothetical protein
MIYGLNSQKEAVMQTVRAWQGWKPGHECFLNQAVALAGQSLEDNHSLEELGLLL